jgi:hypothetical protein
LRALRRRCKPCFSPARSRTTPPCAPLQAVLLCLLYRRALLFRGLAHYAVLCTSEERPCAALCTSPPLERRFQPGFRGGGIWPRIPLSLLSGTAFVACCLGNLAAAEALRPQPQVPLRRRRVAGGQLCVPLRPSTGRRRHLYRCREHDKRRGGTDVFSCRFRVTSEGRRVLAARRSDHAVEVMCALPMPATTRTSSPRGRLPRHAGGAPAVLCSLVARRESSRVSFHASVFFCMHPPMKRAGSITRRWIRF